MSSKFFSVIAVIGAMVVLPVAPAQEPKDLVIKRHFAQASSIYSSLLLSADGKKLLSVSEFKSGKFVYPTVVAVGDAWENRAAENLFQSHTDRPVAIALHPDDRTLAILQHSGTVRFFDLAAKKELDTVKTGVYPVQGVRPHFMFSPDGKLLAVGHYREIKLFDTATRKPVERIPPYQVNNNGVCFRPDPKGEASNKPTLAMIDTNDRGQLWDVASKKREMFFYARGLVSPRKFGPVIAFRSDGKILACAGRNAVSLYDFSGDLPIADLPVDAYALAFCPNSNLLALARKITKAPSKDKNAPRGDRHLVELWDIGTQKLVGRMTGHNVPDGEFHCDAIGDLTFSADGSTLLAEARHNNGLVTGFIHIWKLAKGPIPPAGPVAGTPGKSRPEERRTYRAHVDYVHRDSRPGNAHLTVHHPDDPYLVSLSPTETDMRLLIDGRDTRIDDFQPGDLVEVSYASRRYPSTEVVRIDHDPERTRRYTLFLDTMKPLGAVLRPRIFLEADRTRERAMLTRPAAGAERLAAEEKAAAALFKLIEEAPADPLSFRVLTELLALSDPSIHKKAGALMVEHHLKDPRTAAFLTQPGFRALAPDDFFERLLKQDQVSSHHARACMVLANRTYHRAKLSRAKDEIVRAIIFNERLKREFPKELMSDFLSAEGVAQTRAAAVIADMRLLEIQTRWLAPPKRK